MNKAYFISLWFLVLAVGCKKDELDTLPKATREGKNTGGCLIDGQAFIAKECCGSLLSKPIPALFGGFAFDSAYFLQLNGQYKGRQATLTLFLQNRAPGLHLLNQNTGYYPWSLPSQVLSHAYLDVRLPELMQHEIYGTDPKHTGHVNMTEANQNTRISAGAFEFEAVSLSDSTKTIKVTHGRFDRKS